MWLCPSSVPVSLFSPTWAADDHNTTSLIDVVDSIHLLATVKKQKFSNGNKNLSTWYARRFFVCLVWLIEHEYSRGFRPCTVTIPPVHPHPTLPHQLRRARRPRPRRTHALGVVDTPVVPAPPPFSKEEGNGHRRERPRRGPAGRGPAARTCTASREPPPCPVPLPPSQGGGQRAPACAPPSRPRRPRPRRTHALGVGASPPRRHLATDRGPP